VKGFNISLVACTLVLGALSILSSCQQEEKQRILSHNEMVTVMSEIYIIEDKINRLSLEPDSSRKIFERMKIKVEEKTGVSDSVFQRSMKYYRERPAELEKIYTALVDSLNLKEQTAPIAIP
jgi:hypothetical protein